MKTAFIKDSLRRAVRKLGWEFLRTKHANFEPQVVRNILRATSATVVLDVGANVGQYGDLVLGEGYQGKLVSFEAMPAAHRLLSEHARKRSSSWIVAPCAAIGSKRGQVEFNVAGNSVSSSVLQMKASHLDAAPLSKYVDKQIVEMARLDEIAVRYFSPSARLMIKIDTQGYELEVLKGATGLLPQTHAIQLELSLISLYDGGPSFLEMVSFADSIGFEFFSIVPGFWDVRSGRSLQVDGFFIRRGLI